MTGAPRAVRPRAPGWWRVRMVAVEDCLGLGVEGVMHLRRT